MPSGKKILDKGPLSNSGIQTLSTGNSVIPSSVRSDGSTRKEIKVRPGYKPPEDQQKYKNRILAVRNENGSGGVPGADPVDTSASGGAEKNKNAKRREAARRKAAAMAASSDGGEVEAQTQLDNATLNGITDQMSNSHLEPTGPNIAKAQQDWRDPTKLATNEHHVHHYDNKSNDNSNTNSPAPISTPSEPRADTTPEQDLEKKARNLKKKLRQARDLEEKKDGGGELLPEQLAKVTKIQELIRDLDKLGYSADGQPKANITS